MYCINFNVRNITWTLTISFYKSITGKFSKQSKKISKNKGKKNRKKYKSNSKNKSKRNKIHSIKEKLNSDSKAKQRKKNILKKITKKQRKRKNLLIKKHNEELATKKGKKNNQKQQSCKTNNRCKNAGGVCQLKSASCTGTAVNDLCKRDTCTCCITGKLRIRSLKTTNTSNEVSWWNAFWRRIMFLNLLGKLFSKEEKIITKVNNDELIWNFC